MPKICLKAIIITIISYHLVVKHYQVEKYLVDVSLPESFEFIEVLVNGKTVKTNESKIDEVEDFLKKIEIAKPEIHIPPFINFSLFIVIIYCISYRSILF